MADTQEIIDVIKRARDLITEFGYQPQWRWAKNGPLNIRSALTIAVESCDPNRRYELYCLAVQSFSAMWGGPLKAGLLSWETYKRHTSSQVMELFEATIQRLENDEAHPRGPGDSSRRSRIL